MIIQRGLIYDNKQNIIIPKDLSMQVLRSLEGIEGFDGTLAQSCVHVVLQPPAEVDRSGISRTTGTVDQRRIRDRRGVLIRERIVFLKRARVYAAGSFGALPDTNSGVQALDGTPEPRRTHPS